MCASPPDVDESSPPIPALMIPPLLFRRTPTLASRLRLCSTLRLCSNAAISQASNAVNLEDLDTRPANDGRNQPARLPPFDGMRRQRNSRGVGWEVLPLRTNTPDAASIASREWHRDSPSSSPAPHPPSGASSPRASSREAPAGYLGHVVAWEESGEIMLRRKKSVFPLSLESPFSLALIPPSLRYSVDDLAVAFPHPRTLLAAFPFSHLHALPAMSPITGFTRQ